MPKISLPTIQSGYGSTEALNQVFADVAEAFDNTVSRDGSSPNFMEADVDMNSNRILNLPEGIQAGEPVTVGQIGTMSTGFVVQRTELYTALGGETAINFQDIHYVPGSNNLGVYKNGLRQFTPTEYAETDENTITFVVPLSASDDIVGVTNEYFGSLEPPTISLVPWTAITGAPSFATRDPTFAEVTGKPSTFPPDIHNHTAAQITSGRITDAVRGVYVQASTPASPTTGDLWFW